ncbi:gamma subclass chorismate mutase AroQ [Nocardia nova]|uniref:chorismate mutase n=1 Tax=Nocardia nova TaxID=37330 RepID=A0A2S6AV57_9NOCA|nr:gamma subclass chorismate mutase AroQ [Nocardia nova]PPJ22442.1 gamma subclass chorismate mutase AroQ [Nocardia nova]PPJ39116.1 gamma subclass chorismate mutase AroQ [Nocardia nova]
MRATPGVGIHLIGGPNAGETDDSEAAAAVGARGARWRFDGRRARRRTRLLAVAVLFTSAFAVVAPMTAERVLPHAQAAPAGEGRSTLSPLVELVLRRLNTADAVAAAKWTASQRTGQPPVVDDPAREAQVYDAMAAAGTRSGLPQEWVRQVFTGQIEANKTVQYGLLARWRFDPAVAPAPDASDLAAVRPVIDEVNDEILNQLASHRTVLSAPDCAQQLAAAAFPVLTSGRVDALHGAALVRAAVTLCPATYVK